MSTLYSLLVKHAQAEGFPLSGAVDIDLAFADTQHSIRPHIERYDRWLEAGFAGTMDYLRRGRDRRADPRLVFPEAESVFCVAMPYPSQAAGARDAADGPRYARYLQGPDYHVEIAAKLERVMRATQTEWLPETSAFPVELKWKICVDTSAVLERSWAALAGLGWIGKNTLLIHPKFGSYLFLGEVLINQRTHRSPAPLPNFCGHCTQCLKSCPPQALSPQGQLNSNQCISYWTLEKKGPHEIPDTEQKKIHTWIAGCDLCQEVCPFNQKISRAAANEQIAHALGATALQTWAELLNESPEEYKARVRDSALSRIKYSQSSRNLAIALHNQLEAQATEASRWQSLIPLLQKRLEAEADSYHRENWKKCLALLDFDSYSTF